MVKHTKLLMSNDQAPRDKITNKMSDKMTNQDHAQETGAEPLTLTPIACVHSPFAEKFAIPRQPGLASAAKGEIIFEKGFDNPDMVRGLSQFSHLWLVFVFHGTQAQGWKPLIRPPRLGGNEKIGVLASRSTFRPNPIGMSVVKLEQVLPATKQTPLKLIVSGLDLLDQTPILDIKPYVPYSDAIVDAQAGYAQTEPSRQKQVSFAEHALTQLGHYHKDHPELKTLIEQVLCQDPRPAYKQGKIDEKQYGMQLYQLNISWHMTGLEDIQVTEITPIPCS